MNYVPLGEIVTIAKGKKVSSFTYDKTDGYKRYIQIDDLRNDNNLKYSSDNGVVVNKDDLIIVWDGANAGTIGYGIEGIIGSTLAVLRKKDDSFSTPFLGRLLKGKFKEIQFRSYGATIPHVKKDHLLSIPIPEFNNKDQTRIAEILDKADALRQKRKESIKLLDEFLRSTFLEMFGDPVVNPKGWKTKKLEYCLQKIQIGPFGSQLHQSDYVDNATPIINPRNMIDLKVVPDYSNCIASIKYNELTNYHLKNGDIIMARRGEMGRCAEITEKEDGWFCGTGSLFLRLNELVSSVYLLYVLTRKNFIATLEKEAIGITMMNLNKTILNNLIIPLPPINLQNKFAEIVHQVEKLKAKYKESEKELDNLFGSLMQRAFRGEL